METSHDSSVKSLPKTVDLTDEEKIKFVDFLKLHGFDIKDLQNHIKKLVRELGIIDSRLSLLYSDLKTSTQIKKELNEFRKLFNIPEEK